MTSEIPSALSSPETTLADRLQARADTHDRQCFGSTMGLGYYSGVDAQLMRDAADALRSRNAKQPGLTAEELTEKFGNDWGPYGPSSSPAQRRGLGADSVARIICSYLTGKAVSADGTHDNWLCPQDDDSANAMCTDMAEEILAALAPGNGAVEAHGRVPDRETYWLVERIGHQQYVKDRSELPALTNDPWRAARFATEREAHEFRLRLTTLRDECKPIEHMFINKVAPSPAALDPATVLREALEEINAQAVCFAIASDEECFQMLENCAEISDKALSRVSSTNATWQPVDTAPKDGRTFYALKWNGSFEDSLHWPLYWNGNEFEAVNNGEETVDYFTHWMIPGPVTQTTEAGK
jgi:hypothetical protein